MAQLGCFVPAEAAALRPAAAVFSRLGTGDSIECGASTFELEMKEMAYILGGMAQQQQQPGPGGNGGEEEAEAGTAVAAAEHSLVVIDELGRGTSASEGAALCWAITEEVLGMGGAAFCLLATHFELITRLETVYPTVKKYNFPFSRYERKEKHFFSYSATAS